MSRRASGEGCIRFRKDGRWEGRFSAGCDLLTGKTIIKSVYAKTKKECAAKLARAIQENKVPYFRYGKGSENSTVADWIRIWFDTYTKPGLRPSTVESYTNVIENHIIPMIGHFKLNKLNSLHVQKMYNELRERGKLSNSKERLNEPLSVSMVKHVHMVLSGALKQAVKEHLITYNPCENCKLPKLEKKEMTIIPTDKIGSYLEKAEELGVLPLFCLELASGLRRGELLALNWDDLDIERRMISVNKQVSRLKGELVVSVPKTVNSIRKVVIPQYVVDLLIEEHNKHPNNPLMFVYPRTNGYWSPEAIGRIHKKILDKAGINQNVRFHDLRHTFATMAIQNGVDVKTVSSMLGHFSSAFTLDTYTHVTEDMQRGAADKIGVFITNIQVNININQRNTTDQVIDVKYEEVS